MEQNGKSYQIRVFRNTDHAWLNLNSPSYHHESAEAAWGMFLTFLQDVFAGKWNSDRAIWRFESDSSVNYDVNKLNG